MKITFLDFEQSIAELEAKIEELRFAQDDSAVDISAEILRLQKKSQSLTNSIYSKLTPWQISHSPISKSFTETGVLPMTTPSSAD